MTTTSAAAYEAIKASGLITKRERQIVDALYFEGDLTGEELDNRIKNPSIHKRLAGLQAKGVVFNPGTKTSPKTGRKGLLWGLCDSLPDSLLGIPLTTRPRPRKALIERIIMLEAELLAYQAEFGSLPGREAINSPETARNGPVYYFYSLGHSKVPSSYYGSLKALLADCAKNRVIPLNIWTGSHQAPLPVAEELLK